MKGLIKLTTASSSKTTTSTLGASSPTSCSWIRYTPAACKYVALSPTSRKAFVIKTSSLNVSIRQSSTLRAQGRARPIRTWPQSPPRHRKCTMPSLASTKWALTESTHDRQVECNLNWWNFGERKFHFGHETELNTLVGNWKGFSVINV